MALFVNFICVFYHSNGFAPLQGPHKSLASLRDF